MVTPLRLVGSPDPAPSPFPSAYSYEEWVEDLRGIVWNAFVKGYSTLEDLAVKANLSKTTVENFAWGETKRPHGRTLFQIASAVGYRMPFIPDHAPRQPDEPDLAEYRGHIRRKP